MTHQTTRYLIVGGGVTSLAFANFLDDDDWLILEREEELGGYCRTIAQDGFVWDYSGHFFHFRHADIEQFLRDRMDASEEIRTVEKSAKILYGDGYVDFPFQKNIHQLPQEEFLACLHDLVVREPTDPTNFREMIYARFGVGIADRFLVPYNEKLYATDLSTLDVDAMGRFFPHADLRAIVENFVRPKDASYNATFTYPRGGAIQYVNALARDLPSDRIALGESVVSVDLDRRLATTSRGRTIAFETMVSSAPFPALLSMTGLDGAIDITSLTSNKVLVFNLGFDRKGLEGVHWVYVPQRDLCFYRVGFYDNIFDTDRMSLYVEIGLVGDAVVDVEESRSDVLRDLRRAGIVQDHQLVAWHSVVLDPAYVHISQTSREAVERARKILGACGVYTIGRYGGWTYCSIEDNILEARELASLFNTIAGTVAET